MPNHDALLAHLHSVVFNVIRRLHEENWQADQPNTTFAADRTYRVHLVIDKPGPDDGLNFPPSLPLVDPASLTQAEPKKTIAEKMEAMLRNDRTLGGWAARKWAERLGCSVGAIHAAPAWTVIMKERAFNKAERLNEQRASKTKSNDHK